MPISNYIKKGIYGSMIMCVICFSAELLGNLKRNYELINRLKNTSYEEVIAEIKTPEQARWYIQNYLKTEESAYFTKSFKRVHEERGADCADATVAAAALLSDDNFPANYLIMLKKGGRFAHSVFFYEKDGKYGTLGINDIDNNPPIFSSLEEIVRHIGHGYDIYRSGDLSKGITPDWITTPKNLDMLSMKEKYNPRYFNIQRIVNH